MSANRPGVVVLDYGSGNVRSAVRALQRAGADVTLTADRDLATQAQGLVVPGVGAFAACMGGLLSVGAGDIIEERLAGSRPVLGICVGMQVMFGSGVEHGVRTQGFQWWPGVVDELHAPVLPHMGWNCVDPPQGSTLFHGVETERFYFVHSYGVREWCPEPGADTASAMVTWTEHGDRFISAVESGALSATQFHPEKSGDAGHLLLRNWLATL